MSTNTRIPSTKLQVLVVRMIYDIHGIWWLDWAYKIYDMIVAIVVVEVHNDYVNILINAWMIWSYKTHEVSINHATKASFRV